MSKKDLLLKLRKQTGAGIVECSRALEENSNDLGKALEYLRKKGLKNVTSKAGRVANEGLVHSYIHPGGKVGVLVEVNCETDFVARNEEFKEFVHDVAMHIAALSPEYVSPEDVPEDIIAKEKEIYRQQLREQGKPEDMIEKIVDGKMQKYYQEVCLLKQAFIKDEDKTVEDLLKEKIAKLGENIQIKRFCRFSL